MSKHHNVYYLQLSREIFQLEKMSIRAKWLFVVLNELEQRYCNDESDYFYRTDDQLCKDTGFSINTLKRAKAELKQYPHLIQISRGHWINSTTGKKSTNAPTCYKILV